IALDGWHDPMGTWEPLPFEPSLPFESSSAKAMPADKVQIKTADTRQGMAEITKSQIAPFECISQFFGNIVSPPCEPTPAWWPFCFWMNVCQQSSIKSNQTQTAERTREWEPTHLEGWMPKSRKLGWTNMLVRCGVLFWPASRALPAAGQQ